jgi:hypothetical protein
MMDRARTGPASPRRSRLRAGEDALMLLQTNVGRSAIMHRTPILCRRTLMNERVLCRRRVGKGLLSGLAALLLFCGSVGQARSQFLYWANRDGGTIERANLDGTGAVILVDGQNLPTRPALDLASGLMYWANNGGGDIWRAKLDGSEQTGLVSGLSSPNYPVVDLGGGFIYWSNPGEIWRAKLDGSDPTRLVAEGGVGLALDLAGGKMYWSDQGHGTINRANLDGSNLEVLVDGQSVPRHLALDLPGGRMYWTNGTSGDIRRAHLDGSGQEIVISGLISPIGIALDLAHAKLYWSHYVSAGDIRRANLDGSGQETLITGLPGPTGIALDLGAPGTAVFFAVAAPASAASGNSFDLTVTALDPYGNRDVNYQGTVTFSTTDHDSGVVLPADYTFTTGVGGDNGVHIFSGGVTLVAVGDQSLTVIDKVSGITGSASMTVGPGP